MPKSKYDVPSYSVSVNLTMRQGQSVVDLIFGGHYGIDEPEVCRNLIELGLGIAVTRGHLAPKSEPVWAITVPTSIPPTSAS